MTIIVQIMVLTGISSLLPKSIIINLRSQNMFMDSEVHHNYTRVVK
jgi:hypothetical protein